MEFLKEYRDNLLSFIEWLYENKSYMMDDVREIDNIYAIITKQDGLNLELYDDWLKNEEYNNAIASKWENLTYPGYIKKKAEELRLYERSTTDIKNNLFIRAHLPSITPREVSRIKEAKEKYMSFRKYTDFCAFGNGLLFSDLDIALKGFFGAFTDVSDMERTQSKAADIFPIKEEETSIVNNFDTTDIKDVIKHFGELERNMKNDEFMEWIKQAFETMRTGRKFSLTGKIEKQKVKRFFYEYWNLSNGRKKGTKEKYVRLLSDYFNGFTYSSIASNFSKKDY